MHSAEFLQVRNEVWLTNTTIHSMVPGSDCLRNDVIWIGYGECGYPVTESQLNRLTLAEQTELFAQLTQSILQLRERVSPNCRACGRFKGKPISVTAQNLQESLPVAERDWARRPNVVNESYTGQTWIPTNQTINEFYPGKTWSPMNQAANDCYPGTNWSSGTH